MALRLRPWVLAVLLAPAVVLGKVQTGSVHLTPVGDGEGRWHYLGKFGYAIGSGTYQLRLRMRPVDRRSATALSAQVDLDIFLDEEWDHAQSLPACRRAIDGPARVQHRLLRVSGPGQWGPWENSSLYQVVRPHIWYFTLSDCRDFTGRVPYVLDYELRMQQFDGSELSFEQRRMPAVNALVFAGLSAFAGRFAWRCHELWCRARALHPVVRSLAAAVALQWAAQALHLLHLWASSWDGLGLSTADGLSGVLFTLSQAASATLLLAIARGYTLTPSKVGQQPLLQPLVMVVAALHALLAGLSRLQGETADTHHDHAGAAGCALLALRILLYVWFAAGIRNLRRRGGFRLGSFLDRFQAAGTAYLLAFPALWAVAQLFAPYLRHPLLHTGLHTMQASAGLWLAELFLSRSAYHEVSELSASLLPGGARCSQAFSCLGEKED